MANSFLNAMENLANEKVTENGAFALKSTKSSLMDLFGTIGSMRTRSDSDVINAFVKAYSEDRLLAMKMLFYARDIREGLGERKVAKTIFSYMAKNHKEDMEINMDLISEYGRWDDFYAFVGTPLESLAFAKMKDQFTKDLSDLNSGKNISLLAKWLKSLNTSSVESKKLAAKTAKYFYPEISDFNKRSARYRKDLSKLRAKIEVVETLMSAKKWEEIKYENVPSKATSNYREAFRRHDEERYENFINDVKSGKSKINSAAMYPYELIRQYTKTCSGSEWDAPAVKDDTIEEQWKALPNFVTDDKDFLIMADVSGSMSGLPISVSISLGIYFAERNKGLYHNKIMTFESKPEFVTIPEGVSLAEKVNFVDHIGWGGSTNLEAAFNKVLDAAIQSGCKQEELPEALVVITDMEIDDYGNTNSSFTKTMKKKFADAGYKMPTLVWWNVNARQDTFHAEFTDESVRFVSGLSATVFKSLCENMGSSAMELMLMTLNSERYDAVKIA